MPTLAGRTSLIWALVPVMCPVKGTAMNCPSPAQIATTFVLATDDISAEHV